LIFPAFAMILVLVAVFFLFKIKFKMCSKIDFPAFGTILVLAAACFYSKGSLKSIQELIFLKLLARSWFWRQLFCVQNLWFVIQKSWCCNSVA